MIDVRKVIAKLTQKNSTGYLRGLWIRRKFTHAGWITVLPGRPYVHVVNRGGEIICGSVILSSGIRIECSQGARISIGTGTFLNRGVEIIAASEVRIGRNCKIARDVVIMDTDQHEVGNRPATTRPIIIEDNVWIGCRAIILKGVTIGANVIVGAGAIVTKDVPPGVIVTSPAATIRGYVPGREPSAMYSDIAALPR